METMLIFAIIVLISVNVEGSGIGSKCKRDSQCSSGNCCGVWPFKRCRQCCKDSDCQSGFNCKNRQCIGPRPNGNSCGSDSDCSSNRCCGIWPLKRCRECCKDSHCPSGKNCKNRVCIQPRANGKSCIPDSDCASGHCCGVVPFKRCRECCKDSHCSGSKPFCINRVCSSCLQEGQTGCDSDAECCGSSTCCGAGTLRLSKGDKFPRGVCISPTERCCAEMGEVCVRSGLFSNERYTCCDGVPCGETNMCGSETMSYAKSQEWSGGEIEFGSQKKLPVNMKQVKPPNKEYRMSYREGRDENSFSKNE